MSCARCRRVMKKIMKNFPTPVQFLVVVFKTSSRLVIRISYNITTFSYKSNFFESQLALLRYEHLKKPHVAL